jgi:nuclear GTP-binding protein
VKAAEEKQRKKDGKKAAKADHAIEKGSDAGEGEGEPVIFDGVGSVTGQPTIPVKDKRNVIVEETDMELEDVPILINHDLPNLRSVLDQADVIVQVLDARDPLAFRSSHLEQFIAAKPGGRMFCVLTKIGLLLCRSKLLHAHLKPQIRFLENL